ncbi:hypothetical protein EGM70_03660 [Enterobacteriaceae bacterium 89]|nr:hypothetical protein [Enterobacteriaceae bacterium 89]
MRSLYLIEDKVIYSPDTSRIWPVNNPQAYVTLYVPASQCLLLLITHAEEVLTQPFLSYEVWEKNGLYVNTNTLYQNIAVLRKSLKQAGLNQEVIKTIPRMGLKFIGNYRIVLEEEPLQTSPEIAQEALAAPEKEPKCIDSQTAERTSTANSFRPAIFSGAMLPCFLIAACLATIGFQYRNQHHYDSDLFNDYRYIGNTDDCRLYSSYPDKEISLKVFHYFSESPEFHCAKNESVLLTLNRQYRVSSAVKCLGEIKNPDASCVTWIYRDAHNDKS